MTFKSWSLYQKISGLVGLLIFFSAISAYYSIFSLKSIHSTIEQLAHVHFEARALSSQITDRQRFMVIQTRNIIIESDGKKLANIMNGFLEAGQKQDELFTKIEPLLDQAAKAELATYKENRSKWFELIKKAYDLRLKGQTEEVSTIIFSAQTDILNGMLKTLDTIRGITTVNAEAAGNDASTQVSTATTVSIALGLLSALLSGVIAFFVINGLKSSIQRIVGTLSENARLVASASHQIASTAEELSQASTEQATSLEQTSSSIEEMNSMVGKNSDNASKAASTTHESSINAKEGQDVVAKMILAMGDINQSNNSIMEQVDYSNQQITEIVQVIKEIGLKTKVINDIVFQTKLLSFNASVEAARAGDQGKGFAVVAEEVGNLAQMSGNAAKEITELLDNSIHKVESIVNETKTKVGAQVLTGKEKVNVGTEIANQCGEILNTIVMGVSSISKMAEEISVASNEQALGVNEITKAISQLDSVTQQNSATSEETASAAEELSAQAESLSNAVEELVATIDGTGKRMVVERTVISKNSGSSEKKSVKPAPIPTPIKKTAGMDGVPSHNHAGFEDV